MSIAARVRLSELDIDDLADFLREEQDFRLSHVTETFVIRDQYPFTKSTADEAGMKRVWGISLTGRFGRQRKDRELRGDNWRAAVTFLQARIPKIWYFPNFLFEFPDRIYLEENSALSRSEANKHAFYRRLVQDILDSLDNDTNVEEHLVARAKSSETAHQRSLEHLALMMSRHVTSRVFGAWNNLFHENVAPNRRVEIRVECDANGSVYARFQLVDADGHFEISERSLGFRWFFVYLLLTSYRAFRRDAEQGILLLLDEPASNLHSTAQSELLKSFEVLAERCTVIYATHSHHLINTDWLESTYIVRNEGLDYRKSLAEFSAKQTDITLTRYRNFAAQYPDQTTYFQPILDVLEYRPSMLENVPNVVMVEGKNDYYVLRYLEFVLTRGAPMHFLPGGGAGELDTPIALYLGWARPFGVLLDGDGEGRAQADRYCRKFGEPLRRHITLLSEVDGVSPGAGMERMLEPGDRLAIQQAFAPDTRTYKKKLFNRAVQDALVAGRRIDLSRATRDRFQSLFRLLERKQARGHSTGDGDPSTAAKSEEE